jgi:hypothetical protein
MLQPARSQGFPLGAGPPAGVTFLSDGGGGPGDGEVDPLQQPLRFSGHAHVLLGSSPLLQNATYGRAKRYVGALRRLRKLLDYDNETMPPMAIQNPIRDPRNPVGSLPGSTRRLAWFHVPKCSTSIGTTFGHFVKPELPETATMPACSDEEPCEFAAVPEVQFMRQYALPQDILWTKGGNWGDHTAIDDGTWQQFRGHFVGLFRDPVRRAISAYKWFGEPVGEDVRAYAHRIRGTTVRMMAGQRYGLHCNWPEYPCDSGYEQEPANLDRALDRLGGFKYVGMTDEYPLSVCLFHAMFGGECMPSEFQNMRPSSIKKPANSNLLEELNGLRPLGGLVDEEETTFFLAVYDRYCSDLAVWGVTQAVCKTTICPRAAEHFEEQPHGGKYCDVPHQLELFLRGQNQTEVGRARTSQAR